MTRPDPFRAAFDPQAFRDLGHRLVDRLADHLASVQRRDGPVLPWTDPEAMVRAWPADFTRRGSGRFLELVEQVLSQSNHLHHPRYVGHQVTSPLPLVALAGLAGDLLNNGTAIYEMGPVTTAMERTVVRWLAGRAGWDAAAADGVFTNGGSIGNLTALLAARQHRAPWDVWEEGTKEGLCLVACDQAHYSVRRAAQIMGLGGRAVRTVASDARFRMRPDDLDAVLRRAEEEGRTVLAVVASAGSTATGAVDPLEAIADVCAAHGVWMHVDGAHGGAAIVSDRLRPALAGIERADSLVIDAHKMMLVPALVTVVLFRDGDRSYETFSQQASYLFQRSAREQWFDLAQRTLECTKRMLSLHLYAALETLGTDFFAAYVEHMYDLGQRFAEKIRIRPHWELATPPEGNIVCCRYAPPHVADADAFQARAREAIVREGSFYFVKTTLRGKVWLRTTLINPLTEESDLEALLARVEREAVERKA